MKSLCLSVFFLLIAAILGFYLFNQNFSQDDLSLEKGNSSELHYFNDSILVFFNDFAPRVLELDLYRRKEGDRFRHDYLINFYGLEETSSYEKNFFDDSEVKFGKFEVLKYEDASTRLNYDVLVSNEDFDFSFNFDVDADFITKNELDFTRYSGVADGEITVNGETFTAMFYVENAYAADYTKLVFFPGLEELQSQTQRFVFFDENDDFYLLDHTEVFEENPYYPSHSWYLQKVDGSMKKGFDVEVERSGDRRFPSWQFQYEDRQFELVATDMVYESWSKGRLEGVVNLDGEQLELKGLYSFKQE